ncbi:aldo/keto reductase [Synechococcus sp. PCC 7502]|uniref:aldo/keto reductase n=1 Tax=Synechococcus sp. PCC 7502 TaxID=1173263 RepID=UPI000308476B|nr:aldo/keto reductase [Synechococcus sp. PCC 7502]
MTEFPKIGIGTWAWGDNLFWDYAQANDKEQVRNAFLTSLESGITFFDTAEVYGLGESERLIGKFLQEIGVKSQNVQIATKFMPLPWRFNAQNIRDSITASLNRLQLNTVALYQVHQPVSFLISQKTLMQTLADEVKTGRIAAVGISNYSASQMREAHTYLTQEGVKLAVNQVRYSLLDREIETNGILATAKELGVTILAYSPLAQGLLTGKYRNSGTTIRPTGARKIDPRFKPVGLTKIEPLLQLLEEIGAKYNRSPAQIALNWLIYQSKSQSQVIPIPGAKTASQARENAGALGWSISPEENLLLGKLGKYA